MFTFLLLWSIKMGSKLVEDITGFIWDHKYQDWISLRCSRGKNCSKMGWNWAEICLKCSTGFFYCLWKKFWNQNWFVTLQALIWYHKHWDMIILKCTRGKNCSKKRAEISKKFQKLLFIALISKFLTFLFIDTIERHHKLSKKIIYIDFW